MMGPLRTRKRTVATIADKVLATAQNCRHLTDALTGELWPSTGAPALLRGAQSSALREVGPTSGNYERMVLDRITPNPPP